MKIDWVAKLTSRKFWAAIVGFITPLIIVGGGSAEQAAKITAIIMSGAVLIAYIIGEGLVDAAHAKKEESERDESAGTDIYK